jgi:L-rhamnose isomerase / sugar isomerase
MSVVNIQDAYARALIVDRPALRAASAAGDVLAGHQVLLDAYNTDVRSLCASARRALGAADDPVAALRASGRAERIAAERSER